jgi:regulator of sigma E protease
MILTAIAFIVIFSILILVHECGHFFVARHVGIKVEEFGIGLPPRAKEVFKDKKGTVYSLNWVPFGGFVKMYGEDSYTPKIINMKSSFAAKTMFQRSCVILAGVFMNFVLAWLLISIGFTFGMKPFLVTDADLKSGIQQGIVETEDVFYVHEIIPGSPLSKTDVISGDIITSINDQPIPDADQLSSIIKPNQITRLGFLRNGKEGVIDVTADSKGELGFAFSAEQMVLNVKDIRYPFYLAPLYALKEVGRLSVLTVQMLGDVIVSIVARLTVPEGVSGPVGIAKMTHYFVKQGLMALVHFTALISISLGVINVMPFPALDGGRFLFIIYEFISRRRPNAKIEGMIHTVGFALLMALILVITWHDITNLFK